MSTLIELKEISKKYLLDTIDNPESCEILFLGHNIVKLSEKERKELAEKSLVDEPTANLDSKTTMSVIDLMLDLNKRKGVTLLFSKHDEKLLSMFQIIFLTLTI